ncbi:MAG: NAD(P)H-dependent glycerol-3-phosphate dehydrogenase [Myxococcota bacterium]
MASQQPTPEHDRDTHRIHSIGVIGAGSWGTALARLLAVKGYDVRMWVYEPDLVTTINTTHENTLYLPGFTLPDNLIATHDLREALTDRDMILQVVPSHVVREVMTQAAPHIPVGVPIVSASKGIENESLMLVNEILEEVLPIRCHPYLAYLSGPSFAKEVAADKATAVVIASYSKQLAQKLQYAFHTPTFRTYTSHDVIGIEVGGALKNVIAIAAGAAAGLGLGHNAMAGVITRGLNELTRLAVRKGANALTLSGLAGMGDLVLTCTGNLSRNRTVGYKLGQGLTLEQILSEMNMVAEGVKTSKSVHDLAHQLGVEMPISEQVYQVLYADKSAKQAVHDLLARDLKAEMSLFS